MKTQKFFIVILSVTIISFLTLFSCKKESSKDVTNISAHDESRSHNAGQNCMKCHDSGGEGTGWFSVAGTVYQNDKTTVFSNATVKLYTDANGSGSLKYTINGDNFGNFFTTEQVDFGSGLYPAVEGSQGTKYMSFTVKTGQCNSCHGSSQDVIWTE